MEDIAYEDINNLDVKVLGNYDILQNDDGEILIVLPIKLEQQPSGPVFYYDGRKHAVLLPYEGQALVCDEIHPGVRKALENCENIFFCTVGASNSSENSVEVEFVATLHWQAGIQEMCGELIKEHRKKS